ncbi:MAG TPA: alpha/beta hydrolase, partial [Opitutaceae bacterium]|nr:alpha/beta hydrolase [Opitutaceae bacterium]
APSDGEALRWRRLDGTTGRLQKDGRGNWTSTYGWTDRPDGTRVSFSDGETVQLHFNDSIGQRVAFNIVDTKFESHGVTLAGRLVLPKGEGRVPVVVLVHGAEHDSALASYSLQRLFPAQGIGAFVYDKRGTGKSAGSYTQDFDVLADDAVAAMREARKLAGSRVSRIGYQGGSQGGWVAPLAANRAPVDFVIVCFGLAITVIEEDQQEVALEMRLKGHPPEVIAKALEVASAAETVFASGFTQGFAELDAVRAKYKSEPWYKDIHGNYAYFFLPYSEAELREKGAAFKWGTPFHYESMPTLRASTTPQLWILGEDDFEAPSEETGRRIKSLIAERRSFTLAMYPGAEHGMTEYETASDGERISTRYASGYFEMMRDFVRDGRLHHSYGRSSITPTPSP